MPHDHFHIIRVKTWRLIDKGETRQMIPVRRPGLCHFLRALSTQTAEMVPDFQKQAVSDQ